MDHLAPKESIAEKVLKVQNDSVLKLDEMAEKLSVMGMTGKCRWKDLDSLRSVAESWIYIR